MDHTLDKELAKAYEEAKQAPLSARKPRVILSYNNAVTQRSLEKSLKDYLNQHL